MKIIAEFNSNEELLSFVSTFGATALQPASTEVPVTKKEAEAPKEDKKTKKATKEKVKEEPKEEPKNNEENETSKEEVTEAPKEETAPVEQEKSISKEEVRAVFTKLLKAGKGKEAKELTAKYGASKLGELKEEDYAAVLKEAEELM